MARSRAQRLGDKLQDYARSGIKLYLIISPEARVSERDERNAERKHLLAASTSRGKVTLPVCEGPEFDLDALSAEVDLFLGEDDESEKDESDEATSPEVT